MNTSQCQCHCQCQCLKGVERKKPDTSHCPTALMATIKHVRSESSLNITNGITTTVGHYQPKSAIENDNENNGIININSNSSNNNNNTNNNDECRRYPPFFW